MCVYFKNRGRERHPLRGNRSVYDFHISFPCTSPFCSWHNAWSGLPRHAKKTYLSLPTSHTRIYRTIRYHVHIVFMLLCIANANGKGEFAFGWKGTKTNLCVYIRTCYRRRDDKKKHDNEHFNSNQTVRMQRRVVQHYIVIRHYTSPICTCTPLPCLSRQLPII